MTGDQTRADAIAASLVLAADRGGDITTRVYARLFADRPDLEALFGSDASNAVKGEMLAQVFDTILDLVGPRLYAGTMIRAHGDSHAGYGVSPALFLSFFSVVAATVAEVIGADWPGAIEAAWTSLLHEIAETLAPA